LKSNPGKKLNAADLLNTKIIKMKKKFLLCLSLFISVTFLNSSKAQVICIYCYDQNDSISHNVTNLLLNGGFENHNCIPNNWYGSSYCPNSSYYSCDINNWTCTGGGSGTYADVHDNTWLLVEGNFGVYFGSYYCAPCNTNPNDTFCITTTDCESTGIPTGYPTNDAQYGGSQGLSIEQTVSGLNIGSTYVLEFWVGGESGFIDPGLFGVDVGFGYNYLRNNRTTPGGIGKRFIIEFNATSSSHTIKFTNWGHICSSCTELTLDDAKLYSIAELNPVVPPCTGANVSAIFSAPNHICPGTCTDFTNLSTNASSFVWSFPGANPSASTDFSPTNICYNTPGSYGVTLIASGISGSDTLFLPNYITVYPFPAAQGISQNGDTLFANAGAVSYQWYENGVLIPGATDYFYIALESGNYNVVATDNNGCEVEAVIFDVIAKTQTLAGNTQLAVYPNPVKDKLLIKGLSSLTGRAISVYDLLGKKILTATLTQENGNDYGADVSSLIPGMYFLELNSNGDHGPSMRTRFKKE
jgi:PKD repeat protein